MTKVRAILFFSAIAILAVGANLMAERAPVGTGTGALFQVSATPEQSAIFASFVAAEAASGLDTALSISNVLHAPSMDVLNDAFAGEDRQGTLEFHIFLQDGSHIFYETHSDSPGEGLDPDGSLSPGRTYTVLLSEILEDAGFDPDALAVGYMWVVANFDAVQGTNSVTFFEIGFTQFALMSPPIGSGFFAGIPGRTVDKGVIGVP